MKKSKNLIPLIVLAFAFTACTRIETGEVGVRIGFDKQVAPGELLPGSFNQTIVGSVITFPVKDVAVKVDNLTPIAKDNSTMKDFDAMVIYNINPSMVSELYTGKNKNFHMSESDDIYLMYNYIHQTARNAIYKATRNYEALDMNDNRSEIELKVREGITQALAEEKLDGALSVTQVQVRAILPADSVVASANDLVRAKNEYKQKEIEVKTAEKESERMAALSKNSQQSIAFMQAQAQLEVAKGIAAGKVHTIVVPMDFKGMVNVGK